MRSRTLMKEPWCKHITFDVAPYYRRNHVNFRDKMGKPFPLSLSARSNFHLVILFVKKKRTKTALFLSNSVKVTSSAKTFLIEKQTV